MNSEAQAILTQWISLRDLSRDQIRERLSIEVDCTSEDTRYIELTGLTELYDPDRFDGHLYFRDQRFVLLYIEDPGDIDASLTPAALKDYFGEPEEVLRSRAGKQHSLHVYSGQGIAFSASVEEVSYLEIFQPTSREEYMSTMYFEPSDWVR